MLAARFGTASAAHSGKKPSSSSCSTSARVSSPLIVPPMTLAAAAEHGDRGAGQGRVAEELLLGLAAGVPEHEHLAHVELDGAGGEGLGHGVGQGQVHVVAAEQDVVADGHAGQDEPAVFLADGDQA